jgi:hypothetical protein
MSDYIKEEPVARQDEHFVVSSKLVLEDRIPMESDTAPSWVEIHGDVLGFSSIEDTCATNQGPESAYESDPGLATPLATGPVQDKDPMFMDSFRTDQGSDSNYGTPLGSPVQDKTRHIPFVYRNSSEFVIKTEAEDDVLYRDDTHQFAA